MHSRCCTQAQVRRTNLSAPTDETPIAAGAGLAHDGQGSAHGESPGGRGIGHEVKWHVAKNALAEHDFNCQIAFAG